MMNTTLKDYIKVYKQFLDPKHCSQLIENLAGAKWGKHRFYSAATDSRSHHGDDCDTTIEHIPGKDNVQESIKNAIWEYTLRDMAHMNKWFGLPSAFTNAKFNKYNKLTRMNIHCDHIHSIFDGNAKGVPILSILGALNDNYKGGELFLCGEHIDLKAGDIVIFPSNFLYPHEVKPVQSGTRYSFASWAW